MQKPLSKLENRLITIWLVIGISVILGFFCFSAIIGGSALNGYIENGSFFDLIQVSLKCQKRFLQ